MTRARRVCRECCEDKALEEFSFDSTQMDGPPTVCRRCDKRRKGALRRESEPAAQSNTLQCRKCLLIKPLTAFHKGSGSTRHGVRQPCRVCRNKTSRSYDTEPRFRVMHGSEQVRCTKCKKWLAVELFSVVKKTGKANAHCKACRVKATKTWLQSHRDKVIEQRLATDANTGSQKSFADRGSDRRQLLLAISKRYNGYLHSDRKRIRKRLERQIHGLTKAQVRQKLLSVEKCEKVSIERFLDFILSKKPFCECCNKRLDMSVDSIDFAIDHFHDTGLLRGLLCNDCNLGIGSFSDDVATLARAKKYLERHHAKR